MGAATAQDLVQMVFDEAARQGDRPVVWAKRDRKDPYVPTSWRELTEQVAKLSAALRNLGIGAGDRVVLVSESRPEWLIADLAIMAAGAITVPTYVTNTARDHEHILYDSGARAAIVSTRRLALNLLPAAHQADTLNFVISMEPLELEQRLNVDIHAWDDLVVASAGTIDAVLERIAGLSRDEVACLVYTSGTGGAPKGVMTSHGAILHNCAGALDVLQEIGLDNEVFLSFLPLSHAYEHTAGQFFPLSIGAQIYYAESIERLADNMAEVRPTIMTVVPRLFELLRARVTRAVEAQGGIRARLFQQALELGTRRVLNPGSLTFADRLNDLLLETAVRRKVRQRFGGRIKALVSGGAPLNADVAVFFHAFGLRLLQGYGQTESGPVVSVNRPSNVKMNTVGPPLKNTEVKIAEDGEILIRGELVMKGYWNDSENSESCRLALRDGWLHTGDIGNFDEDGHLQITDRMKDIIVNDKGDNISPARVEGLLTLEPEIAQAMVYGDRRPHMVGLLVPDREWLHAWATQNAKPLAPAALENDPDLYDAVDLAVAKVNKRLSNMEKVRRFALAPEAFTVDNEQMTPTMKLRRHVIVKKYGDVLEALYQPNRRAG
jgi:long-chain acyl-CoA synthetase